MADLTRIQNTAAAPIATPAPAIRRPGGGHGPTGTGSPQSFGEILRSRQGIADAKPPPPIPAPEVRFSAHAQTRLQSRRIALDAGQIDRLQGAVQKAAGKGSRDALVLMDDLAMVVSVTNRTVVTVVDKENLKQNVFTNIDSAVIA